MANFITAPSKMLFNIDMKVLNGSRIDADDCVRRKVRQVVDPDQQRIINEEAESHMIAAYINFLYCPVDTQVCCCIPSTLTEGLHIATTVQEVELMEARQAQAKFTTATHNNKIFTVCFNCNKVDHLDKKCRQRRPGTLKPVLKYRGNRDNFAKQLCLIMDAYRLKIFRVFLAGNL